MKPCPKHPPFRSDALRRLASKCPHCMNCGVENYDGNQLCLAHGNTLKEQKGISQKANDIPCYLCKNCHDKVDGRLDANNINRNIRDGILSNGRINSFIWLLESGYIGVK